MRIALGLLTALLLVFCVHTLATGDEGGDTPGSDGASSVNAEDIRELRARIEALELESRLLRSRDVTLTTYVLLNERRANVLNALVAKARKEGFENNRIPAPSRVSLLAGLDALADDMRDDLPRLTKDEQTLIKKLKVHRKMHDLGDG
jgi:hypothetical protein